MVKKYFFPLLVIAGLGYGVLFLLATVRAPFPSRVWLKNGPPDDYGKPTWDTSDLRIDSPRGESLRDYNVLAVLDEESGQWTIRLQQRPNWGNKQLHKLGHRFQANEMDYRQSGGSRDNEQGKWWLWQKQIER